MQQMILADKCAHQQDIKERDQLFIQLQRQNLSLKASLRDIEQARSRGCQLLRLCVGLLRMAKITVPAEITEYLGNQ